MTETDIHLLYEYDRWANTRVLRAVAVLTPEQFIRDLGGAVRSVRDALVHIIGAEWCWLTYWKEPSHSPKLFNDLWTRHDILFNPDAFPDFASVQLKWAEVESAQTGFVNRVTNQSLESLIPFHPAPINLAHQMQHLANHSTYHRGQVALMMRQLGAEPLATDFHMFLAEAPNAAQAAH